MADPAESPGTPRVVNSSASARRVGLDVAGVLLVVSVAVLWGWLAGAPTARVVRRGFAILDPVLVLEIAAALLVFGLGSRLMPIGRRRDLVPARRHTIRLNVSSVVALSAIVALAAVFRTVLVAANHTPKVLGDELIYSGVAKGWALHWEPLLRGSHDVGHSTLYPLLLAPAFHFAADGAAALAGVKIVNAVSMALTAVPAFVFARRVVPRCWALGVAALTAMVPWTAYSALTMTESLFYPVFVAYAAILAFALERPSLPRQAAMLGTLALLIGVRAQGLTVAFGTLAAILVYGALDERGTMVALRRFLPTFAVFAAVLALGIAATLAGVVFPTSSYNTVYDSLDRVVGMLEWGVWNLALFELALGVVALVAFPIALEAMFRRGARPAVRASGAVALGLSVSLLASVALLSASPYGLGVLHERNLFYVTPLVLTCVAYWLSRGLERPFWLSAGCAAAAVALAALLPPNRILSHQNNVDVPSASFFVALDERMPSVDVRVWVILIAAVGAGTFLFARRPLFPILTVVLAFAAITTQVDYRDSLTDAQARSLSWVDHALPAGTSANLVYIAVPRSSSACAAADELEQQHLTTWTEFFNTRIGAVAHVDRDNPTDGLGGEPRLTVRPGGLVLQNGSPLEAAYVVVDSRQPLVGKRLARFDLSTVDSRYQGGASLTLWRVARPLRFTGPPRDTGGGRGGGGNLIHNGEFEANIAGWTGNSGTERITQTTARAASGKASMRISPGGSSFAGAYTGKIEVEQKTNLILSFFIKGSPGQRVLPTLEWFAGDSLIRLDQPITTLTRRSWQLITYAITSPDGIDGVVPAIALAGTSTSTFYVDSVRLVVGGPGRARSGTATGCGGDVALG